MSYLILKYLGIQIQPSRKKLHTDPPWKPRRQNVHPHHRVVDTGAKRINKKQKKEKKKIE